MQRPTNPIQRLMGLYGQRRFAEMEAQARVLLTEQRDVAMLHEMLGIALCAQQRFDEALEPLQRATLQAPQDPQFLENLALCQRQLKHYEPAEQSLRKSLQLRPKSTEALSALGSLLRTLGRSAEAEAVLRQALALAPRDPAVLLTLGNVLADLQCVAEAETCYRGAISGNLANPAPYVYLAVLLSENGRAAESLAMADAALRIIGPLGPSSDEAKVLADQVASVLIDAGRYVTAADVLRQTGSYRKSMTQALLAYATMRNVCDWVAASEVESAWRDLERANGELGNAYPFNGLMMRDLSAAQQLALARNYSGRFAEPAPMNGGRAAPRAPGERLRIGYFSGDLRNHAVGYLVVRILESHDRDRFEIIAYDYSPPVETDFSRRIEAAFDRVALLHDLSSEQTARRIAADNCHIVVDLTGWTKRSRSSALRFRPAPIQVQWLGYPGTLGACWYDYIVADKVLIRSDEEQYYTEKIIRMPFSYQPNAAIDALGGANTRADHGLPDDAFVFCSFNQSYKITPDIFDRWMLLLHHVKSSVLWLSEFPEELKKRLGQEAESRGISRGRLVFAPFVAIQQHLARLSHADLALDCFPYGSHTTASDALWAGVPLVALAGDTFASRVSASILSAAALGDLVTTSFEDYYDLALRYAADRDLLAALKARVRECRGSPLFDAKRFTRDLESAYSTIDRRYRAGLTADHISIP